VPSTSLLAKHLLADYRRMGQSLLTVVDVETTGFYPPSRVMEISVLQGTLASGIQSQQTSLINPETIIPAKITQITGISQAMVEREGAIASELFPQYLPLLNSGILTAHNIEFDYPFLRSEYQRLGVVFDRPEVEQLCTVQLSRLMLPELPSRSLPNLVKHFGFPVGRSHRAEADTLACWLLAERLLTELLNEADEVLLARFARQWIPLKDAAKLLGCSQPKAKILLAVIPSRVFGSSKGGKGSIMYRRGDVEQVFYDEQEDDQQGGSQLSLL
jgi:DNA polymerase III subunit epsilon